MDKDLIFAIGETLLLELDGVKNVTYPKGVEEPEVLFIELENGNRYELAIREAAIL